MKKNFKLTLLTILSAAFLVACTADSETKKTEETPEKAISAESQYQTILDEYTLKIEEKTPILIAEYKEEAKLNSRGIVGLADISNSKIEQLAEISTEGMGKMAKVMVDDKVGMYSKYEGYANQLTDVYMSEAKKITNAYMESAN